MQYKKLMRMVKDGKCNHVKIPHKDLTPEQYERLCFFVGEFSDVPRGKSKNLLEIFIHSNEDRRGCLEYFLHSDTHDPSDDIPFDISHLEYLDFQGEDLSERHMLIRDMLILTNNPELLI